MITLLLLLAQTTAHLAPLPEDRFIGRVVVEWLSEEGEDRTMRVVEWFAYEDPSGKLWEVPAGAEVDGASIPEALYSVVGPPFVGDYRRASVVHDYHCERRIVGWEAVHRMFYDAARTGGVPAVKAKMMYAAVRGWGPRWQRPSGVSGVGPIRGFPVPRPAPQSSELNDLEDWITNADPSLDDIDRQVAELLGES
jgi:hypothetical protein